jgi:hypothetical protein
MWSRSGRRAILSPVKEDAMAIEGSAASALARRRVAA